MQARRQYAEGARPRLVGPREMRETPAESVVLRMREEVAGLLGGMEIVEPGVVQLQQWRPEPAAPAPGPVPMWCGVGRKTPGRA